MIASSNTNSSGQVLTTTSRAKCRPIAKGLTSKSRGKSRENSSNCVTWANRARNTRDELFRLFEGGKGQDIPAIRGSLWAAFNAVTEYADHHRPTRTRNPQDAASSRLDSAWFGSGSRLKQKAFHLALQMATAN
jgi:hypothetical protein